MHILLLTFVLLRATSYSTAPLALTPPKATINDSSISLTFTSPLFLPASPKFSLEILNANGEQINYSSDIKASKYTLTTHTVEPIPAQIIIKYFVVHDDMTDDTSTFIHNQPTPPGVDILNINILVGTLIIATIIGLIYYKRKQKSPLPAHKQRG